MLVNIASISTNGADLSPSPSVGRSVCVYRSVGQSVGLGRLIVTNGVFVS